MGVPLLKLLLLLLRGLPDAHIYQYASKHTHTGRMHARNALTHTVSVCRVLSPAARVCVCFVHVVGATHIAYEDDDVDGRKAGFQCCFGFGLCFSFWVCYWFWFWLEFWFWWGSASAIIAVCPRSHYAKQAAPECMLNRIFRWPRTYSGTSVKGV